MASSSSPPSKRHRKNHTQPKLTNIPTEPPSSPPPSKRRRKNQTQAKLTNIPTEPPSSPPPSKRRRKNHTQPKLTNIPTEPPSSPPSSKRRRKNHTQPKLTNIPTGKKKSPLVVFAHGAGAPSTSDWMIRWKERLGKVLDAVEVVTFDYPYMSSEKRSAPPKADKLVEYHCNIIKEAVDKYPGHPLILVGKSMGSRVSCMVASEDGINASGVVCLGYPLKGTNGTIRDEILLKITVPIMFVQGSKDNLCPLDKLSVVRKKMNSINELHVVNGGDHSFKIGKKLLVSKGSTQEKADDQASKAIADFVAKYV